jgi:FkbM family methyltransferase
MAIAGVVRQGDVCFDCGGWHGFFSGVMALAGASRVFVFEPLPANVAQLRKMIALNPGLPISLIEAAVTEQSGTLEFVIMPESSMGKLTTSSFQQKHHGGQTIRVRAVTLDALLAAGEVQPPAVMKIDVEGAELMLLRGARNLLAAHKPKLFMEIHSGELARDCRGFLTQLGYEVRTIEPGDPEICHLVAQERGNGS